MLTLNQIIDQIKTLANAHYQIAEVGVGTIAELQAKPDRSYPLLWLSNEGGTLDNNYKVDNIRLTMFGRVTVGDEGQDDDASELEVLSDMQLILLDFLNYFHQNHGQDYVTDKSNTLEHFTERTNDRTAGYSTVLELKQFYDWNKCQIPQSGASIPPTVDGLTLYDFCDADVIARLTPTQIACLEAELCSCADAVITANGQQLRNAPSGQTTDIPVHDTDGNDVGETNNFGGIDIGDTTVRNQTNDWSDTEVAEGTYILPFGKVKNKEGNDVQVDYIPAADGYIFEETACPAGGGSISVAVSDASPSLGNTITITATPSDFTPDSYLFFAYDDTADEIYFIAEQASNSFNWQILGLFAGTYTIYVLGVESGTPDVTAFGTVDITVSSNFILDTPEGTGANFAFAFFKLRAAYTGSAALIRRSSDNAQKDFYFDSNGVLSLSSEDGSGTALGDWIGGDDGYLVTGYSQDTVGVTFTAANAADQAKVITGGVVETLNNIAAMLCFDDTYVISTTLSVSSAFIVAENSSLSQINYLFANDSPAQGIHWGGTSATGIGYFNGSTIQTSIEDLNPHIASVLTNDGVYVDGSLGVSSAQPSLSLNRVAGRSIGSLRHRGKIACIIAYSTDKTADRAAIEANIDSNFTPSIL